VEGAFWKYQEEAHEHDHGKKGESQQTIARADLERGGEDGICTSTNKPSASCPTAPACKSKVAVVMCQAQKAELTASAAQTSQYDAKHLNPDRPRILQLGRESDYDHATCGESDEDGDSEVVGYLVDEIRGAQLCNERGYDIGEEDDAFGDVGPDEIEGGGEDDHVEDVVDEAWEVSVSEVSTRFDMS
jgi:hypothetical protein